jgi:hypothetical protein
LYLLCRNPKPVLSNVEWIRLQGDIMSHLSPDVSTSLDMTNKDGAMKPNLMNDVSWLVNVFTRSVRLGGAAGLGLFKLLHNNQKRCGGLAIVFVQDCKL